MSLINFSDLDVQTQQELAHLFQISWIVLIPVGVLLSLVLYQLFLLLYGLVEFLTVSRYELTPILKDVRRTAEHVEILTNKAVSGVRGAQDGFAATGLAVTAVKYRIEALFRGLRNSFSRTSFSRK